MNFDLALPPGVATALVWVQWLFFAYFVVLNLVYLALNYVSAFSIHRYMRDHHSRFLPEAFDAYQPPVSVLVPAHNEEKSIVATVSSLLKLDYPGLEIVVVNDGSTDGTLEALVKAFSLVPFPEAYRRRIETEAVNGIYASTTHPRIRMVDKVNGGKADALNAGINCARYPLFCVVDADCILQRDSLARVVQPFLEDATTVASGGVIRVVNGCTVKGGFLGEVELPRGFLPMVQLVEYLRAFLFGRLGWSPLNALLIISGAFGLFHKERVIAVGGYKRDALGEDMELVVRLHRVLRKEGRPYRITFVPDPICWTEAPEDLRSLRNQRMRWQQGLAESLASNWRLMFSRRGGVVGWVAFPFMLVFECIGPLVEVLGYVAMIVMWLAGLLSHQAFLAFLFAAMGLGVLLSTNALFLEELSFHRYPRARQQLRLFLAAVLENFGYRQLNSLWRVVAMVRWALGIRRVHHWGEMRRHASWHHEAPAGPDPVAAPVAATAAAVAAVVHPVVNK